MTLMLNRSMLRVGLVLVLAGWLAACGAEPKPATYKQEILQHRMQRDMNLRDKNSVLAPSLRDAFKGLHYFPVDSSYRFQVSAGTCGFPRHGSHAGEYRRHGDGGEDWCRRAHVSRWAIDYAIGISAEWARRSVDPLQGLDEPLNHLSCGALLGC